MPHESHESLNHCLGADRIDSHLQGSRKAGGSANRLIATAILILALLASGCAQSTPQQVAIVKQSHDAIEVAPTAESGEALKLPVANSDFTGNWSVEWCDKTNPELDCGGFSVTLVQKGARICGDYGGALVNMRQVDEGEIVGTIVGNIAILAVGSMRNNMIALVRAELHGGDLHWEEVDAIKKGGTDIAIIATNDVLAPTPTKREDSPRSCNALVSSLQEG
ncbi:hypothetical protein E2F46_04940 [Luteimonas aestuarii]|uniref:Uncharacterized protein n=1 Tax=Luteimonas aestuarii TaxID=453837 RepID=A0A4R5TXN2_9GAMM|nr:hypothetical protein [Luteimonas aestuarii]TDK25956.1 hypothetical protein E2F46_04940 [Luteimonas aestuarii]